MRYINKLSSNTTEAEVQSFFHNQGYMSIRRGWPDFCFWKNVNGKREYLFIEVKKSDEKNIKPWQRKVKNIFADLGLKYKVCFGMKDGMPNFDASCRGINKRRRKKHEVV